MKKILILTADFVPYSTATTNCILPLIKELKKKYLIEIVTAKRNEKDCEIEKLDGIIIYRIPNIALLKYNKINSLSYVNKKEKIKKILNKLFIYLRYNYKFEGFEAGFNNKENRKFLNRLIEKEKYDFVLSISNPITNHLIIKKIRQKMKFNWLIYEFDPIGYHSSPGNNLPSYINLLIERSILKKCDSILLTNEIYHENMNNSLKKFIYKMHAIDFALIAKLDSPENLDMLKGKCIFLGNLNDITRNPSYAIEVFNNMQMPFLTLMTNYSGKSLKQIKNNTYIKTKKFKPHDEAIQEMLSSDILISIGNNVINQMPSKIFEYISSGKPIVHFYKRADDPTINYLIKYPMSLLIDEKNTNILEAQKMINDFYSSYSGKKIPFDQIESIYSKNTPYEVGITISNILEKINNE